MYNGICKCNSSRFWNETSNMAKFTKLMETSFNAKRNIDIFLIKQEIFSFIMINRQFVSNHPRKNILHASFNRCESRSSQFRRKRYIGIFECHLHKNGKDGQDILT